MEGLVLSPSLAEALSVVLLVVVLACALVRPWGWPEAVVAVPAAVVLLATGATSLDLARAAAELLGPGRLPALILPPARSRARRPRQAVTAGAVSDQIEQVRAGTAPHHQ